FIVWRRFDVTGLLADVWTMKPDGSDQKQITDFGAMSWAPYEHPSGRYFIFSSNKLGFDNFELFMVDVEGRKEPVRVTYSDGFDGLAVPSPDGRQLAWTSTRGGGSARQIFLAQWNHDKAPKARALSFSDSGDITGSVVFAGYGIVVPESQDFGYDSYATLDVKDKVVVVLRYFPEDADQKTRGILARYSDLRYKAMAARQRGAKALLVVTGPRSPNAGELVPMTFDTALSGS